MADITSLTMEEKASLGSGADFWSTKAVADLPPVSMTDGPHGVRKQGETVDHLGMAMSVPATCFPPAAGLAQSWNPDLVRQIGEALGREARAVEVDVLLGPGVNIKRHPLGGRNFEYYSEDPLLAGVLGAAWVEGIQSQGVGASVKHYAANNQETDRHKISADIDARTLREIYLRAFQRVVQLAKPWTVMSSYNAVNGIPVSEHEFLLTTVLRDDWGFDGVVVSDWGAVADRVAAARAGLDLQMPAADGVDDELVRAVQRGELPEAVLDRIAGRVSGMAAKVAARSPQTRPVDMTAHHALAQEAARQSVVLLRNEDGLLPLSPGVRVAVIGEPAIAPRFQGGGSSFVNTVDVDVPLDELRRIGGSATISYAAGFGGDPAAAIALIDEAVAAAKDADVAIVFLAPPIETEGFDRESMDLPPDQLRLVDAVLQANPRTVVVLARGGVLRLGALEGVPAILDGALLGEGIGRALAEVVFGVTTPSGRLAETVPHRLHDTPAFGNFPGEHGHVLYGEGLLVGYRWYDARAVPVAFPFGHGLSYTTFGYDDLRLVAGDGGVMATFAVTNTGDRVGREVAQVYASLPDSEVLRAPRELKGLASIELQPGERRSVSVLLRREDLAYWDIRSDRWTYESGEYHIAVGASSRDLRLVGAVAVQGDVIRIELTMHSTIGELLANPVTAPPLEAALAAAFGEGDTASVGGNVVKMISPSPLQSVMGLLGASFDPEHFQQVLLEANR